MRIIFILLNLFFTFSLIVNAAPPVLSQVEKIHLNIKDHEMAVTFLGLSEGEATLIQGPNDENILVNTGGKDTEAELEEWLGIYHVKKVKSLILTKELADINQINRLVSKYNIKEIITTAKIKEQLQSELLPVKMVVTDWKEGTKEEIIPNATAIVQYAGNQKQEGMDFKLQFFDHSIFFMSSTSQSAEKVLLKKNLENVNVFKLPNYTTDDVLSGSLIQFLNPEIAVLFSIAEQHQPNSAVLEDLHETWSEIYYTKKHGTITIKFTETKYEVITIPAAEE
ncbi:hypothetical protein [Neobacillus mesonae]|uniref:hypothetical protein n=1 Tax=Neobacillus mesonae TaxID=1193713 RepID=UPI00203F8B71|nr:hypothetical protein [Neobacillus mesonae]MCM3566817.1 hypothetical protein [Neobacillus mesonae]